MSSLADLRVNSTLIKDVVDDSYVVVSNNSNETTMEYSKIPILGASISSWVESIDAANKKTTLSAPMLVQTYQEDDAVKSRLGYKTVLTGEKHPGTYRDLYQWLIESTGYRFENVEGVDITIGHKAEMNVKIKSNSPYMESGNAFIMPEFQVIKSPDISKDTEGLIGVGARALKQYDICAKQGSTILTDVFVSKLTSKLSLTWKPIKSIPTVLVTNSNDMDSNITFPYLSAVQYKNYTGTPNQDVFQGSAQASATLHTTNYPFVLMNLLSEIENDITIEMYVTSEIGSGNPERWIAAYWQDSPPLEIRIKNTESDPPLMMPITEFLNPITSNLYVMKRLKVNHALWRITSLSITGSSELPKITLTMKGVYGVIPLLTDWTGGTGATGAYSGVTTDKTITP